MAKKLSRFSTCLTALLFLPSSVSSSTSPLFLIHFSYYNFFSLHLSQCPPANNQRNATRKETANIGSKSSESLKICIGVPMTSKGTKMGKYHTHTHSHMHTHTIFHIHTRTHTHPHTNTRTHSYACLILSIFYLSALLILNNSTKRNHLPSHPPNLTRLSLHCAHRRSTR